MPCMHGLCAVTSGSTTVRSNQWIAHSRLDPQNSTFHQY